MCFVSGLLPSLFLLARGRGYNFAAIARFAVCHLAHTYVHSTHLPSYCLENHHAAVGIVARVEHLLLYPRKWKRGRLTADLKLRCTDVAVRDARNVCLVIPLVVFVGWEGERGSYTFTFV